MLTVVTAGEMRKMDQKAIEDLRIPGLILMENAGIEIACAAERMLDSLDADKILIVCGKGNNGGDGMAAARHLLNHGYDVDIVLLGEKSSVKGDARVNLDILESMGVSVKMIGSIRQMPKSSGYSLIVDAILGTGISGPVTGIAGQGIGWINNSGLPVLSVDLPSGLNADTGAFENVCVEADETVTLAALKRGLLFSGGRHMTGEITIADISMPAELVSGAETGTVLLEKTDIQRMLPARPPAAHKGDFGKVLVLAGSPGLTGAATLASIASLRCGCGLTVLGVPASLNAILEGKCTEVMTRPLPETAEGTLSLAAEKEIRLLIEWADVLAVGPGLSMNEETITLIRRLIAGTKKPVVIDADGFNAFQAEPQLLEKAGSPRILTPHAGELAGITGDAIGDICLNPIETCRTWAQKWKSVLVLKGAPTVIGSADGRIVINPTGNSGMATAGSGDVLTGMISGLLAQGISAADAACCGVYCHGSAGDAAAARLSGRSMMAGDLLDSLPEIMLDLEG